MFVWRGWGVLVPLIIFLSSLTANGVSILAGGKGYWETHGWPLAGALVVAGGLIRAVDSYLFNKPARTLVDEKTGERLLLVHKNDLFFIPMKWWGVISAAIGILILISGAVPGPN
jgi:hypothetical protein